MRGFAVLLYLSAILAACQIKAPLVKPPLEEEGEVYVYLQPLPQEAERLRFTLEKFTLVREDGSAVPLSLRLTEFRREEMRRQRLLASSRVPPGTYAGISFRVKDATLRTEDGEAALLVPEEEVRTAFPFQAARRRTLVLSLSFLADESVEGRYRLTPTFSVSIPGRPLTGVTGYLTNPDAHNVVVFDKVSGQVAGVISTGRAPRGIAIDQRSRRAYVVLPPDQAIDVIDMDLGQVVNRVVLNAADNPQEIALTPEGGTLLCVNQGSDSVSFIDPVALVETSRVGVGRGPTYVLVDATGRIAYVFNTLSNTITVIDIPRRAVSLTAGTETGPLRGQLNRRGDRLYVYYLHSPFINVLDSRTLAVQKRFFAGMGVTSIHVDPRTDFLYVSKRGTTSVEMYDPFSLIPGGFLPVGDEASNMAYDGERSTLYLLLPNLKVVKAINLVGRILVSEMDIGDSPYGLGLMGER